MLEIRDTFLCDLLDVKYRKVSYKSSTGDVEVENVNQRQQSIVLVLANNKTNVFYLRETRHAMSEMLHGQKVIEEIIAIPLFNV